jgi:hypothetical protein
MTRALLPILILAAALSGLAAEARSPVVVELYTAQGCASCGKADAYAATLADRPGVVALTFSVDYWDYLGWKDTLAQPAFADRQKAYDTRFGLRDVYTPQMVIDGAAQASGDKTDDVDALIRQARRARPLNIEIVPRADGTVAVRRRGAAAGGEKAPYDVWLIRYLPHSPSVEVTAGENRGKTVVYADVVNQLTRLGGWSRRQVVFKPPPAAADGVETLVLVQAQHGGPIVAAAHLAPAKD